MQWLDDAPECWESAPEDPPETNEVTEALASEPVTDGVVMHDPESGSAGTYIYAEDGEVSLDDLA